MCKQEVCSNNQLTCVCSLVNLQVLASCEDLPTARERTGKGLFARVHSDVIDQLVLGFERFEFSGAAFPETGVIGHFRSADVLHGDVGDNLVHRTERLIAGFPGFRQVLVNPETRVFLLDRWPHIPEERSGPVRRHVHVMVVHAHVMVHVHAVHVRVEVRSRGAHLVVELIWASVDIGGPGQTQSHLGTHMSTAAVVESREQHVSGRSGLRVMRTVQGSRRRRRKHV